MLSKLLGGMSDTIFLTVLQDKPQGLCRLDLWHHPNGAKIQLGIGPDPAPRPTSRSSKKPYGATLAP